MILVVGATGQLGSLVVGELGRQGRPVRAMVRPPDAGRDLAEAGAELVTADLLRPGTLDDALRGVRAVIATADVVAPTHRGDGHAALARGYVSSFPARGRPGSSGSSTPACRTPRSTPSSPDRWMSAVRRC